SQGRMGWRGVVALFIVGLFVSGMSGAFAYFLPAALVAYAQTGQAARAAAGPSPQPSGNAQPAAAPGGSAFTVLLLGSDDDSKFEADAVLTQSMILVRVDPASRHVTMLSIPRDLYVPLSSGGSAKIDAAYRYGGAPTAVATVERNFRVHVDNWVWVGLRGLVRLIDYMGGVDVTTSSPVIDDFYPADLENADPYAYKRVLVLPGPQHLDGIHAMEYVRSRHGDAQEDFGRSQRQQQVLLALKAKAKGVNPADLPGVIASFNGEFKTSMNIADLARVRSLLSLASQINDPSQIEQIVLLPPYTSDATLADGEQVLTPNWNAILPLVRQRFT
ncbi:MAG TPA: LCP family protein, partial [Candidatus Eisenbacteria bacterium]|nr:LCP family protein [Candidatus Eisenbacteria bacterium]